MIAAHAPDLHDVLAQGVGHGWGFVCLDGTLIASTRSSAPSAASHDVWYSGKHKQHGGNIQVLTDNTNGHLSIVDVASGGRAVPPNWGGFPACRLGRDGETRIGRTSVDAHEHGTYPLREACITSDGK